MKNHLLLLIIFVVFLFSNCSNLFNPQDNNYNDYQSPPQKPTSLFLSNITSNSITLTWEKESDINYYNIYRTTDLSIDLTIEGASYTDTYVDSNLEEDTTYYYKISAKKEDQFSKLSDYVYGTTLFSQTTIDTLLNVQVDLSTSNTISFLWDSVDNVSQYKIYRSRNSTGEYNLILSTTDNSFTDTNLDSDTKYYYKIRIVFDNDKTSDSSYFSSSTLLSYPSGLSIGYTTSTSIRVYWNNLESANSYNIYRSESSNGTYELIKNITDTYTDDNGRSPNTEYFYKITAVDERGESNISPYTSAITKLPQVMGETISSPTLDSLTISWNSVDGADGYKIYRDSQYLCSLSNTTYVDTGLEQATFYEYSIYAYNSNGDGAYGGKYGGATLGIPYPPENIVKTNNGEIDKILFSWDPAIGADEYKIYRSDSESGPYILHDTTSNTNYSDLGLESHSYYYYKISSSNSYGEGEKSSYKRFLTILPPPTNLNVQSYTSSTITITWSPVEGAIKYMTFRSTNYDGPWYNDGGEAAAVTGTEYTYFSLSPNTNYYLRVEALSPEHYMDSRMSDRINQTTSE